MSALAPVEGLPANQPLAELRRLTNTSTQAGTFRATLTAAPLHQALLSGQSCEFWAYNASLPGPVIEVWEGDTVEILFINQLPQPSSLYWHGLPVSGDQSGHTLDAVAPGARRVYRFTLPMDCAGTYWYYPHPQGNMAEQVYRGLTGTLVVRSRSDTLAKLQERLLVCTDLKLNADGQIAENDGNDAVNGREGQFALVNGQRQPLIRFNPGGRERWRIVNASSARYLRLQFPATLLTLVGTDGGLLQTSRHSLPELLLTPGQRAELVIDAPGQGGVLGLWAAPYQRGKVGGVAPERALNLLRVDFGGIGPHAHDALPTQLRRITSLGETQVKKRVVISEETSTIGGVEHIMFLLNGRQFDKARVDLSSRVAEVEQWEVANESDMDHPFHIQGTRFQVIESELGGRVTPEPDLAWRDVVNLKPGEAVRIRLVHASPGVRMFYCQILEQANAGLMGQLMVV
ncbi:MAG: multicopper oxidase family protein [Rhodoferax sp.]|nr:multicopper oxidase family protein [Rhodoferax sp.]